MTKMIKYLCATCVVYLFLSSAFSRLDGKDEQLLSLIESNLENTVMICPGSPGECPSSQIPARVQTPTPAPTTPGTPPQSTPTPHLYSQNGSQSKVAERTVNRRPTCSPDQEGYTINFDNISVIQLIHFISKISGMNFIFDSNDLNFSVSIVSQDPTSVEDLTGALLQVLKIHGLSAVEQGNNVLIYGNQNMSKVSTVITDDNINDACDSAVITRVFRLFNINPERIAQIVRPLLSTDAVVEVSEETRHLIVSDITTNVDKIADLLTALDTPEGAFDIAEYSVKSSYPSALVAYANEILTPLAADNDIKLIAQPSTNKIFIVSTPFLIAKARQILESLDAADITEIVDLPPTAMPNNHFYMYKLKYQNGLAIAQAVQSIGANLAFTGTSNIDLVSTIHSLQWVEANNSIVMAGSQDALDKVIKLIDELDQVPKQVYIEVLIIDTTLQNALDFGVQWIALGDEQDKLAYASGLLNTATPVLEGTPTTNPGARFVAAQGVPPPTVPNPGRDVALPNPSTLSGFADLTGQTSAFGLGIIGNILRHNGESFLTLGALVSALDQESDTAIVLNPRIMVEDTQPADFFVGQNIPYQTTSTVIQQTGSVTQNIQYEDIGVHLRVTPTIAPNNVVTLDIDQSIIDLVEQTTNGLIAPTTNKTLASTRVHVPDGTFLVMSGHIRDRCSSVYSGIPCLGTLPLIGPAFSRNIESRQKRNLIFFVRPKVITNIQEGLDLTNQEGYDYNWESDPCSIIDTGCRRAPECEVYPARKCEVFCPPIDECPPLPEWRVYPPQFFPPN